MTFFNCFLLIFVLSLAISQCETRPTFPNYRSNTVQIDNKNINADFGLELPMVPDYKREYLGEYIPRFAKDEIGFTSNDAGIKVLATKMLMNSENLGKNFTRLKN